MKFKVIIIVFFLISCNQNQDFKKIKITDFSKVRIDTLIPNSDKSYYMQHIKVKGFIDDTIKVKYLESFDIKLSGQIVLIILSMFFMVSCNKDYRKYRVTDFSKKRVDTLVPYKHFKSYYSAYVKVKGYANDTIKLDGIFPLKLTGNIDTIVNIDYYGQTYLISTFDQYKATEGDLEIECSLN